MGSFVSSNGPVQALKQPGPLVDDQPVDRIFLLMNPPLQNASSPQSLAPTTLWKHRRVVVGGGVGASVLLAVILFLAKSAGNSSPPTTTSMGRSPPLPEARTEGDSPGSAETYPIPPELVAQEVLASKSSQKGSTPTAPIGRADSGNPGTENVKQTRGHTATRRTSAAQRASESAGRGHGSALAATRLAPPSISPVSSGASPGRHPSSEQAAPSISPAVDKKHIPLVDDQPRVHILE